MPSDTHNNHARTTGTRVIAFGDPLDSRTFSGYARSLCLALRHKAMLHDTVSCRIVRPHDALFGAIDLTPMLRGGRPRLSRSWLWKARTVRTLSSRVNAVLASRDSAGSLLQVGTLVRPDARFGPHDVVTDMTIPQAAEAGFFEVSRLGPRHLAEAVRVQRDVLEHARTVFTLSQWAADSVVRDFGVPRERVVPIYAGPNLDVAVAPGSVERTRSLVFVGIDWVRKGGPEMLEGFELARKRVPDAELIIIGCHAPHARPGVRSLGYLPASEPRNRAQISRMLASSRGLCLLSAFDPFPNVIVEAYAHALPVIAFDAGSRREIVEHESSGLLVQDRRPETIADAMVRVLTDDAWFDRASARALTLHQQTFNWERVAETIIGTQSASGATASGGAA
ncbi:MAG: glycosyltransferase family 4 protein [Phycisphaerales bacterium]|jgi:glycosyltransferase involved in cell wall biosynthesis|nr:glycosyltransferase family 4 protein [Phycisphaerales bacterium]